MAPCFDRDPLTPPPPSQVAEGLQYLIASPPSDITTSMDTLLPLLCSPSGRVRHLTSLLVRYLATLYNHVPGIGAVEHFQRLLSSREVQGMLMDVRSVATSAELLQGCMARMSEAERVAALLELKVGVATRVFAPPSPLRADTPCSLPSRIYAHTHTLRRQAKFHQTLYLPLHQPSAKLIHLLAALAPVLLGPEPAGRESGVDTFLLSECMTTIHTHATPALYLASVPGDGGGAALELTSVLHLLARLIRGRRVRQEDLFSESSELLCTLFAAHAAQDRPLHLTKAFAQFMAVVVEHHAGVGGSKEGDNVPLMRVWSEMLRTFQGEGLVYGMVLAANTGRASSLPR